MPVRTLPQMLVLLTKHAEYATPAVTRVVGVAVATCGRLMPDL